MTFFFLKVRNFYFMFCNPYILNDEGSHMFFAKNYISIDKR